MQNLRAAFWNAFDTCLTFLYYLLCLSPWNNIISNPEGRSSSFPVKHLFLPIVLPICEGWQVSRETTGLCTMCTVTCLALPLHGCLCRVRKISITVVVMPAKTESYGWWVGTVLELYQDSSVMTLMTYLKYLTSRVAMPTKYSQSNCNIPCFFIQCPWSNQTKNSLLPKVL